MNITTACSYPTLALCLCSQVLSRPLTATWIQPVARCLVAVFQALKVRNPVGGGINFIFRADCSNSLRLLLSICPIIARVHTYLVAALLLRQTSTVPSRTTTTSNEKLCTSRYSWGHPKAYLVKNICIFSHSTRGVVSGEARSCGLTRCSKEYRDKKRSWTCERQRGTRQWYSRGHGSVFCVGLSSRVLRTMKPEGQKVSLFCLVSNV